MDFQEGDIVVLKSGGPLMTVSYIKENEKLAVCIWFDKNQERQWAEFYLTSLRKHDEKGYDLPEPVTI